MLLWLTIVTFVCVYSEYGRFSCKHSEKGASFNLAPLEKKQNGQLKYYKVFDEELDEDNNVKRNFTYLFNVCQTVSEKPDKVEECYDRPTPNPNRVNQYCYQWLDDGKTCDASTYIFQNDSDLGYVYQYMFDGTTPYCYILGSSASKEADDTIEDAWHSMHLADNNNPAAGVVLKYKNGEWCENGHKNRDFSLVLLCEDTYNIPDIERVYEDPTCTYTLTLESIYGCPTECGLYDSKLCGGQGICDYDWSSKYAKCFCFKGFEGIACETIGGTHSDKPITVEIEKDHEKYVHSFEMKTKPIYNVPVDILMNVTYDLYHWSLSNYNLRQYWTVNDTDGDWVYFWALLKGIDLDQIPASCKSAEAPCDFTSDPNCDNVGTMFDSFAEGAVYQMHQGDDATDCHMLGEAKDATWVLYDTDEGAKGASIIYANGGYCSAIKKNRKTRINFVCPDTYRNFSDPDTWDPTEPLKIHVYENENDVQCEYEFTIESSLACPLQCITEHESNPGQYGVCNGRGVCAADPYARGVHCLCDDGYDGSHCEKRSSGNNSSGDDSHVGFQIAISIIIIVLIIVIGYSVYQYLENKKLQEFKKGFLDNQQGGVVDSHTSSHVPTFKGNNQLQTQNIPDSSEDTSSNGGIDNEVERVTPQPQSQPQPKVTPSNDIELQEQHVENDSSDNDEQATFLS